IYRLGERHLGVCALQLREQAWVVLEREWPSHHPQWPCERSAIEPTFDGNDWPLEKAVRRSHETESESAADRARGFPLVLDDVPQHASEVVIRASMWGLRAPYGFCYDRYVRGVSNDNERAPAWTRTP